LFGAHLTQILGQEFPIAAVQSRINNSCHHV